MDAKDRKNEESTRAEEIANAIKCFFSNNKIDKKYHKNLSKTIMDIFTETDARGMGYVVEIKLPIVFKSRIGIGKIMNKIGDSTGTETNFYTYKDRTHGIPMKGKLNGSISGLRFVGEGKVEIPDLSSSINIKIIFPSIADEGKDIDDFVLYIKNRINEAKKQATENWKMVANNDFVVYRESLGSTQEDDVHTYICRIVVADLRYSAPKIKEIGAEFIKNVEIERKKRNLDE